MALATGNFNGHCGILAIESVGNASSLCYGGLSHNDEQEKEGAIASATSA